MCSPETGAGSLNSLDSQVPFMFPQGFPPSGLPAGLWLEPGHLSWTSQGRGWRSLYEICGAPGEQTIELQIYMQNRQWPRGSYCILVDNRPYERVDITGQSHVNPDGNVILPPHYQRRDAAGREPAAALNLDGVGIRSERDMLRWFLSTLELQSVPEWTDPTLDRPFKGMRGSKPKRPPGRSYRR